MDQINILVVDDEKEIADLVEIYLVSDGYKVFKANSAADGLEILEKEEIHLVLLDIMMPGMDGLEMCRKIRETNNIPIIMLSAKSTDLDKILGLEYGADDYITKPFNILEVKARIKAIMRRTVPRQQKQENPKVVENGDMRLDCESRRLYVKGKEINLTAKEFDLLQLFMEQKGKALRKEYLFGQIWGMDSFSEMQTLTVHIKWLRQKIEEDPKKPKRILTVWGIGYRFV